MPHFINDNTPLPFPKTNEIPLIGDPTTHVAALDWNTICQALLDTRSSIQALQPNNDLPQNVGAVSAGVSARAARVDHVHAHGNQAGGMLHAVATTGAPGFMSAADKTKLDGISPTWLVGADPAEIYYTAGNVGIGIVDPVSPLHVVGQTLVDGNVVMRGAGETTLEWLRTGTFGGFTDPAFQFGRVYATPFGPALAIFFRATGVSERRTFSHENTGTTALIHDDLPRASLEAYDSDGLEFPWMRLNSDTSAFEQGAGGRTAAIGGLVRTGGNLVTATFTRDHKFEVGDVVTLTTTEANFPSGAKTVTGVPDTDQITWAEAGSNVASTIVHKISIDTDVHWKRKGRNAAAIALGGGEKVQFWSDSVTLTPGIALIAGGNIREDLWTHSGDQTFSTQRYMNVDATAGAKVETLPAATGRGGQAHLLKKIDASANTVTLLRAGSDTIEGGTSVVLTHQHDFVDVYCDAGSTTWRIRGARIGGVPPTALGVMGFFGTGADGNLTASSGTTVLTKDTYYDTITLSGSAVIDTNNFRLYAKHCNLSGLTTGGIRCNGTNGNNASGTSGAVAAAARAAGTFGVNSSSGAGGNGGTAGGGGAGNAGTHPTASRICGGVRVSNAANNGNGGSTGSAGGGGGVAATGFEATAIPQAPFAEFALSRDEVLSGGVSGGGGGGGAGDGVAGGGGGSGGVGAGILACWFGTLTTDGSTAPGCLSANGGVGGAGFAPVAGNRGGGGGGTGGGGGLAFVVVGTRIGTPIAGLVTANSGGGGAGANGSGTGGGGNGGGTAGSGRAMAFVLDTGYSATASPSVGSLTGSVASGSTGGAGAPAVVSAVTL